jgi:flagellar biosynthetic protein FlhB
VADKSGKTEEPTQRKLEKARKEGQYPSTKEFVGALQFMAFLGLLGAGGAHWFEQFRRTTRELLALAFVPEFGPAELCHAAWQLFWTHFFPLLAAGLAVSAGTIGVRLVTTGFGFSLQKLAPDGARFNALTKIRELPRQSLPALMQAIILIPLFLGAVYAIAREKIELFLALPLKSIESGSALIGSCLMELFWKAAFVFLVFGSVDFFRQMRRHKQDLRMSKQDIKDEMKEMEGNPQMKQRIRRLQRDRARRQMMKEVPTATAVIVNPTHFAVAIRYQLDSMAAPMVVAKGKNYLALRIRQKAMEHEVPIVENPPLAQALYKTVEVGQEIPAELYRAVAEILAYIFKLMNGKLPG